MQQEGQTHREEVEAFLPMPAPLPQSLTCRPLGILCTPWLNPGSCRSRLLSKRM